MLFEFLAMFAAFVVNIGVLVGFLMMSAVILIGFGVFFVGVWRAVTTKQRDFPAREKKRKEEAEKEDVPYRAAG